jgi:phosphate transport system substrate-binding protein
VKLSRIAQLGAVAAVAALTLTACAANEGATTAPSDTASAGPALTGTLVGQGASSQQVAIQAWTAAFNQTNPDVVLNYDPAGSGTGRESFAGAINFAGSDRAFKVDEIAAGGFARARPTRASSRSPPTSRPSRSSSTSPASIR